jgi:two-component system cell cycle sensor histidine kinase/response regulator CckA
MPDTKTLRVLYLEDTLSDFELCVRALQNGGVSAETSRVTNAEEFREQLTKSAYDIVLADYRVPGWTGLEAFRLLQAMEMDVPFILVTGSLGDELATECIKQGMSDYILKDRLSRLPLAVRQAIQRKETADALRQSETEFKSLVGQAPVGIYRSSVLEDRFLAVNPALVKMLGYASADEVAKLRLSRDVYVKANERRRVLEEIATQDNYIGLELQWKRQDGTPLTVRVSGRPIRNQQGETVIHEVVAEDITQQKSLEQQLWQAQKMEAVGRLAGGVAHDFNNLLMVVNGCAELALRNTSEPRVRQYAEQIIAAGQKASLVTRQLLTFSRKHVFESKVLDLNLLVRDFTKLLPPLIGEDVELRVLTAIDPASVKIDAGQTEQVVMNLVVNARDAMPNGGKLVIETASVAFDDSDALLHPEIPAGRYVTLAVSDSGIGMDGETKKRIFEPFFTTKEAGKGTGLGLATVFGIVKQSQGFITVYSERGTGTTFKIYFPRVEDSPQAAQDPVLKVDDIPRGSETILLVEDEAGLRSIAREFLESIGYTVLESGNGAEAFAVALDYPGPIHVILTDLIMPGLRGPEVVFRLKKSRPAARAIFMSGYADRLLQVEELGPDAVFLQKPFSLATLAQKLRTVIDRQP